MAGRYRLLLVLVVTACLGAEELTVTRSRSTNSPELSVTVDASGGAQAYIGKAKSSRFAIRAAQSMALWKATRAALPLASLPAAHCAKSVSFGTRLTVTVCDDHSPDLSCPNQTDERVIALAREAGLVLQLVPAEARTGHYN